MTYYNSKIHSDITTHKNNRLESHNAMLKNTLTTTAVNTVSKNILQNPNHIISKKYTSILKKPKKPIDNINNMKISESYIKCIEPTDVNIKKESPSNNAKLHVKNVSFIKDEFSEEILNFYRITTRITDDLNTLSNITAVKSLNLGILQKNKIVLNNMYTKIKSLSINKNNIIIKNDLVNKSDKTILFFYLIRNNDLQTNIELMENIKYNLLKYIVDMITYYNNINIEM